MTDPRPAFVVFLIFLAASPAAQGYGTDAGPAKVRSVSVAEYRQHLQRMESLVASCSASMTAKTCNADAVGADDEVRTSSGSRMVGYAWLRNVLDAAAKAGKDKTQAADSGRNLNAAKNRLQQEIAEIAAAQGLGAPGFQKERRALERIFASGNFTPAKPPSIFAMLRDRLLQWLVKELRALAGSSHSHWLADGFVFGFLTLACVLLLWWLRQQAKRQGLSGRGRQVARAQEPSPMPGWQQWLRQGEQFAAEGRWRESVHAVYWAAIARLESRGVWPPDRARTPREYLALFKRGDQQRTDLALLTQNFEKVWYGRHPAGEQDYQQACQLQEKLAA